jgi:hypothetical protein
MAGNDAQNAWIQRVLEFNPRARVGAGFDVARWGKALAAYAKAGEAVDNQIAALQLAMRESGDEELEELADVLLDAVNGGLAGPMITALKAIGNGKNAEAVTSNRPTALQAVRAFRSHIETDERVAACDEVDSGAQVNIRTTLRPALAGLEAALTVA